MRQRFCNFVLVLLLLTACVPAENSNTMHVSKGLEAKDKAKVLESWWSFFGDETLDRLVMSALSLNAIHIGNSPESDGTYEGLRRHYQDPQSVLIADIVQNYILYRYVQNQKNYLVEYIEALHGIFSDLEGQGEEGADPRIQKMKSELVSLVKQKATFEQKESDIERRLTQLTKLLPEYITQVLKKQKDIPTADITPILASPSHVILEAPDLMAVRKYFVDTLGGAVTMQETKAVIPDMTVNSFYGISDDVYLNSESSWSVSVGEAIKNVDLESLEAQFSGQPAYTEFKENLFDAILGIERKITSYAHILEQYVVLKNAAAQSKEGASLFTDTVEDFSSSYISHAQTKEDVYKAQLAVLRAQYEQVKLLAEIYTTLGVY